MLEGWQVLILVPSVVVMVFMGIFLISRWILTHRKPKCLHDWKVMDRHVEPSAASKLKQDLYGRPPDWMFAAHYVCIMVCTKCGAIDKTVEEV
jgi:hypothetical protein